jgi:ribonuclease HI
MEMRRIRRPARRVQRYADDDIRASRRANEGLEIAARRCDARIEWVNGHASARRFPLEEFR